MLPIQLLALDLDGTIVNEQLHISDRVKACLEDLDKRGVKVVIATGRMFLSTIAFANQLGLRNPVISYQGAVIRDLSTPQDTPAAYPVLYRQTIDQAVAKQVLAFVAENNLHANLYVEDTLYTTQYNPYSAYYQSIAGVTPQPVDSLEAALAAPPYKIMIIDQQAPEIVRTLMAQFPGQLSVCLSRPDFCEVVHADVSKWQAISWLMDRWNIPQSAVMAVGDHENDMSMIAGAGIGVAMGNAPDNVKALARFVTGTVDEDGVVQAVEHVLAGQM